MRLCIIFKVTGGLLRGFSLMFLWPMGVAAIYRGMGRPGVDLVTGATATLGNVGPGLAQVGPMASYGELHPLSKLVLTGAMWVGRLEVLTVLALLRFEVWRSAQWQVG